MKALIPIWLLAASIEYGRRWWYAASELDVWIAGVTALSLAVIAVAGFWIWARRQGHSQPGV